MLTKRQRNSKLYKFVDSVLDDCATGAREEVLNFAQLQDEFHKISGRSILGRLTRSQKTSFRCNAHCWISKSFKGTEDDNLPIMVKSVVGWLEDQLHEQRMIQNALMNLKKDAHTPVRKQAIQELLAASVDRCKALSELIEARTMRTGGPRGGVRMDRNDGRDGGQLPRK